MSRKQSRKQRRKSKNLKKQQPMRGVVQVPIEVEESAPDRFVLVVEIAERFGVGSAAVRQWRRQGKIKLRKMFGTSGRYGMLESELAKIINGEGEA